MNRLNWPVFTSGKPPNFVWDDTNVEKLAVHDIEPYEVEEVFTDSDRYLRRARKGTASSSVDLKRYTVIGRTYSGRLLKIPFEILPEGVRPVTAFDAGKRDYAVYWRQ